MRLVQVAKALGMTGQQLRHELSQVNFGVKPTDREIPDALAKGIVRFIARKHGLTVDVESIGMLSLDEEEKPKEVGEGESGSIDAAQDGQRRAGSGERVAESEQRAAGPVSVAKVGVTEAVRPESLNVLRKLSLDDVPREAIQKQEQEIAVQEQREEQLLSSRRTHASQKHLPGGQSMQEQIKKKEGKVFLPDQITVKELAEKTGIQVPKLMQTLMKNGVMATINQSVDYDTAAVVATELGLEVQREERAAKAEDLFSRNLEELLKDEPENLVARPPVVVVMGHVDHGKTALLDAIRQTDIVSQEAGGITQHIGAYQVEHATDQGPRRITFLDTPGHEAFTAMRARGAQVTDIVILVVSAEEGVKATTVEALNHARAADVPIIVAITKVDKERADIDRVKGEVAAQGLQPEEWGGTTPFVPCSAVTKQGMDDLLDTIILVADVQGFKANPKRSAVATIIESHLDTALGPLSTVIVNAGTLRIGDVCVCGAIMGRIKAMIDAKGQRLQEVEPSGAARISGLDSVPGVGDILQVVSSEKEAKTLLSAFQDATGAHQKRTFADLVSRLTAGKVKQLKVVLKTDAQGSQEAIQEALRKLGEKNPDLSVKVIHGAVGAVSKNDVMMAAASDGLVLAFHSPVSTDIKRMAEQEGVRIREYAILYELLDEVEKLLQGLVEPVEEEQVLGHLEVRGIFLRKKSEQIIGGKVRDGIIKRVFFRLQRGGQEVGTGRIVSLKHVDKDIKEAKEGTECGMRVEISVPVEEGDVLEAYVRELRRRESSVR